MFRCRSVLVAWACVALVSCGGKKASEAVGRGTPTPSGDGGSAGARDESPGANERDGGAGDDPRSERDAGAPSGPNSSPAQASDASAQPGMPSGMNPEPAQPSNTLPGPDTAPGVGPGAQPGVTPEATTPTGMPEPSLPGPSTPGMPTPSLPEPSTPNPSGTATPSQPSTPTGPVGLQMLDIAFPEGCTGKANALVGSGRCSVELSCEDESTSLSKCFGSDDEWECECDGSRGAGRGVFEGLDHAGACETAARLCAAGEFPRFAAADCSTESESGTVTACETRYGCSMATDLEGGVRFSRELVGSNYCGQVTDEPDSDWRCSCSDGVTLHQVQLPGMGDSGDSVETCIASQSLCVGVESAVIEGPPTCIQDGQSFEPTTCLIQTTCLVPARVLEQSVALAFSVTGSCATQGDDVWECWAYSEAELETSMTLTTSTTLLDNCRTVVDEHIATALPRPIGESSSAAR